MHTTCLDLSWSNPVGNSKGESPLAANSTLFSLSSKAVYVFCVLLSHVQRAPHTLKSVGGRENDGERDEEAVVWRRLKRKKGINVDNDMMAGRVVGVMMERLAMISQCFFSAISSVLLALGNTHLRPSMLHETRSSMVIIQSLDIQALCCFSFQLL